MEILSFGSFFNFRKLICMMSTVHVYPWIALIKNMPPPSFIWLQTKHFAVMLFCWIVFCGIHLYQKEDKYGSNKYAVYIFHLNFTYLVHYFIWIDCTTGAKGSTLHCNRFSSVWFFDSNWCKRKSLLTCCYCIMLHPAYTLGPCELLPSLGIRRLSSVNFSHSKLLLRNHWADWNQT